MNDIVIIGAGGFGREIKCLINDINDSGPTKLFNILGFIDDGIKVGTQIHEYKVLGNVEYLKSLKNKPQVVFGIGHPPIKKRIIKQLEGFNFPTLVHPTVDVQAYNIRIGKGCLICKGTIMTCDIEVFDFVTINLACTLGHDAIIKSYSSLMPSVNVSGEVVIEEGVFVGTGVKIVNQMIIGKNSIIGAGAVISKPIPENCTAVGIPAKPLKFHNE